MGTEWRCWFWFWLFFVFWWCIWLCQHKVLAHAHTYINVDMHAIEDDDVSVFIVPSFKKGQSPIIFDRMHPRIATPIHFNEDLEPPQFFHYARSTHHMIKVMGYCLRRGEGLNFGKWWRTPLQPFVPKGKPANNYNQTHRGWGMSRPCFQNIL